MRSEAESSYDAPRFCFELERAGGACFTLEFPGASAPA
jgi:hypothetical protein